MNIQSLENIAKTVRALSADAVEKAKSGHPGLPLGMAEFGAWLFGERMNHNPGNSSWMNRDRFVLSAGHGSMFLYSLLHLSGYKLPLEELKNFRQLNSLTPGHPEYGHTDGIETTTGPLGQGFANAVGMAMAQAYSMEKFNTSEHRIIDHYVYTLMGDGCMMEGISTEAASLAGHLGLGRLIAFYDSNKISIEGSTELAYSEDSAGKFSALGWHVQEIDAYDFDAMDSALDAAQKEGKRPSLIILNSTIGKGAPNKAGTAGVHGAALGSDERSAFRKNLGLPEEDFHIVPGVEEYFTEKRKSWQKAEADWNELFAQWSSANPELAGEWEQWHRGIQEDDLKDINFAQYKTGDGEASRKSSGSAIQSLAARFTNLIGGSADLAPSNNTLIKEEGDFGPQAFRGRNLHFGVREHAMGAVANGMALYGGLRVYAATFLVFSDYMRPAIRLAALMNLPVIYVFTHDSIFVGEDGPTHQPVEQATALRTIPNLNLYRPADAQETIASWKEALLRQDGPTALSLTRQGLTVFPKPGNWELDFKRGAYAAFETSGFAGALEKAADGHPAPAVIVATGSEVNLALDAAKAYSEQGSQVRVVSMPCRERFYAQDEEYRDKIIPEAARVFAVEAGVSMGWEGLTGSRKRILALDGFGTSAPGGKAAQSLGLSSQNLLEMLNSN